MIQAVSRNPLISTTRYVWVLLGRSWDQIGTKLGPGLCQVTGVITGEVRRCCAAMTDTVKHHEPTPVPSLRIGGNQ